MGGKAEVFQSLGGFQAQQAAADDYAHGSLGTGRTDGFEIFNGAIDKTIVPIMARYGRHKGKNR